MIQSLDDQWYCKAFIWAQKYSHIVRDIFLNEFNHHFADIGNKNELQIS